MATYDQIVDDARHMDLAAFMTAYKDPFLLGWRMLGGSLTKRAAVTAGYMRPNAGGRRSAGPQKESTLVYKTNSTADVAQNPLANDAVESCVLTRPYVFMLRRSDGRPGGVTIGRTVNADVTINDYSVSGEHAQFVFSEATGFSAVKDMSSTNGTAVGTKRLGEGEAEILQNGYWVTIGRVVCQFFTRQGLWEHLNASEKS